MSEEITKKRKEWEKEFDKKFNKPLSDEAVRLYHSSNKSGVYYDNTEIKDFISSLLSRQKKELIKKLEKKKIGSKPSGWLREQKPAFDAGLYHAQEIIKNHD